MLRKIIKAILIKNIFYCSETYAKELEGRFGDSKMLQGLSYVEITCIGNMDTMTHANNSLTWMEEWFLCLEYVHGH